MPSAQKPYPEDTGAVFKVPRRTARGFLIKPRALFFPNAGRKENFIRGGETVTLPGPQDGFKFRMKEPFGTEIILAVASPVQFSDAENLSFSGSETFKSLAGSDLGQLARKGAKGLQVEVRNDAGRVVGTRSAPVFQARAVFTVVER